MRDGWRVSLDRLPLPLLPSGEASQAFAFARTKFQAGYGLVVEAPDGERLETDEIRRRLSP